MDVPDDIETEPRIAEKIANEKKHQLALKDAKREAAVILKDTGLRPSEVAAVLCTTSEQVKKWVCQYERDPESFSQKTRRVKMAMMDASAMALYSVVQRLQNGEMKDKDLVQALSVMTKNSKELDDVREEVAKPDWGSVAL